MSSEARRETQSPGGWLRVGERFSMRGRRALVTGGSLSIGRAIALTFADAGADVAVHQSLAADTVHPLRGSVTSVVGGVSDAPVGSV